MGLNSRSYCCRLKFRDNRYISVYTVCAVLGIKSGGLHSLPPTIYVFLFWRHTPIQLPGAAPSLLRSLTGLFLPPAPASCMLCIMPDCKCNLRKGRRKEGQFSWGMRKAVSQGDRGDSLPAYRRESKEAGPAHNLKGGSQVHPGPRFKKPPDHHQCYQCLIVSLLPACDCWVNF